MAVQSDNGIVTRRAAHSVDDTVRRLEEILAARAIRLFAVIDHSGEAAGVGLRMSPTKVLIFGNPKAGTPVMVAAPSAALDLPLKILVWEDAHRDVWVSYDDPVYLQTRHAIPSDRLQNIAVVQSLVAAVTA